MNIRRSVLTVAAAGLALTLAACGGDTPTETTSPDPTETQVSETTPAEPTEETTPAEAAGTISIWVDETRIDSFTTLGEQFLAETGVVLDVIQKPTGDIKTDFLAQAPTGEGPDLIVTAHDNTGDLVANGVLAPLELGDVVDGFSDVSRQGFTNGGQLYGVPYAVENIALVRNNGLATETPATFDELIAQGADSEFPILIQQGENGDPYHLYPLQTSFGAPVFTTDANGDYTAELGMEGEAGEAFAAYLKKLADEGVLSDAIGGDQAKQAFLDGRSPYMITGPWNIADFQDAGLDVSVLPVPSAGGQPSAPFVGAQGVFLSSHSENALLANQFLEFVSSEDVQFQLYEMGGRTPALTAAADRVEDEILAGFGEAGIDGQPMPAIPEMTAVWEFWGAGQVSIINGQAADPVAAWQGMIENIKGQF